MKKIGFILCSLFFVTAIQSQSHLIKFNFKKGAEYKQNLNYPRGKWTRNAN